jgi:hypothetical protein
LTMKHYVDHKYDIRLGRKAELLKLSFVSKRQ